MKSPRVKGDGAGEELQWDGGGKGDVKNRDKICRQLPPM